VARGGLTGFFDQPMCAARWSHASAGVAAPLIIAAAGWDPGSLAAARA
jgi:hypothetical protein